MSKARLIHRSSKAASAGCRSICRRRTTSLLCRRWEADPENKDPALQPIQVKTWYWTTKNGLTDRARRDLASYVEWAENPEIDFTAVDGSTIDKTFAAARSDAADDGTGRPVHGLRSRRNGAILRWPAKTSDSAVWLFEGSDKAEGEGLKLVRHNQGKRRVFEDKQLTMPTSIEKLEDLILEGNIVIDSSPVTTMCAGNAKIETDGQDNPAASIRSGHAVASMELLPSR